MNFFNTKLNESGRVLIPAQFRHALNLKMDEELFLYLKGDEVIITPLKISLKKIRERVKKCNSSNLKLTDVLKTLREEDNVHGW